MAYHVRLAELARMSVEDSDRVLTELVRSAKSPRSGQRSALDTRIRAFEIRHEMNSDVMRQRLADGSLRETAEIARWLLTLAARENRGRERR